MEKAAFPHTSLYIEKSTTKGKVGEDEKGNTASAIIVYWDYSKPVKKLKKIINNITIKNITINRYCKLNEKKTLNIL